MLGYRLPLWERIYRRWFETAKARKRRIARDHKEYRLRVRHVYLSKPRFRIVNPPRHNP
jgi:hypothetical protein